MAKVAIYLGFVCVVLTAASTAWASEGDGCMYARDIERVEILSDEIVLIHGKFDRYWVNHLKSRCVGLRKNMIVHLIRYGSRMCANDRFGARARSALMDDGPMSNCRFGGFEEIVVEQIPTLRQSLRES